MLMICCFYVVIIIILDEELSVFIVNFYVNEKELINHTII